MVNSVNTNINSMAAVQALTDIGNSMTMTQSHIQSGLKVNSSADNPAIFTIAQGLRSNIGALTAVGDSLSTGIATLQGQSAGATSISTTLTTLLQTVTQAQNQTGDALIASNATITKALGNIDAYAAATTINGVNMLATASSVSVLSNVDGTNTTATTANASTSLGLGLTGLAVTSPGATVTTASILTTAANSAVNDTATYKSAAGVSTTYTFALTAGAAGSNTIAVGATQTLSLANLAAAINATAGSTVASSSATAVTVGGGAVLSSATTGYTVSGGPANSDAFTFTSSLPGATAQTFTFKTTATLAGDVALGATSADSMANMAAKMQSVGINASSKNGILTVTGGNVSVTGANNASANASTGAASINLVNAAISKIGVTLSALGSATVQLQGLSDFMGKLQTSVKTSLGAMVDANLSDESAKLASLQTKQSLAIQSLSLANQGPSALLQLFR